MSLKENKAIARRFVEEGLVHPDMLDEIVADDYLEGEQEQGLETLQEHVAAHKAGLPDWRYVVEDMVAEGDKVVVWWRASGTHTGEWWGIPPSGKKVAWSGVSWLRIANGKIAEQRLLWDAMGFHEQIGTIPPWEELVKQAREKRG
jgi:steroid delta-isomerase-like uncharacterized protein